MSDRSEARQLYHDYRLRELVGDFGRRLGVCSRKYLDEGDNDHGPFAVHWNEDNHLLFIHSQFQFHDGLSAASVTQESPYTLSGRVYLARGALGGKSVFMVSKVLQRKKYVEDDQGLYTNDHGSWSRCGEEEDEYFVERKDTEPFWFVVPAVGDNGAESKV